VGVASKLKTATGSNCQSLAAARLTRLRGNCLVFRCYVCYAMTPGFGTSSGCRPRGCGERKGSPRGVRQRWSFGGGRPGGQCRSQAPDVKKPALGVIPMPVPWRSDRQGTLAGPPRIFNQLRRPRDRYRQTPLASRAACVTHAPPSPPDGGRCIRLIAGDRSAPLRATAWVAV